MDNQIFENASPNTWEDWIDLKSGLTMWDLYPYWYGLPDEDPFWTGDDVFGTGE